MNSSILILPIILWVLVVPIAIGFFVWNDSGKRGMNQLLWTLVAVFVPNLIGLIIYLVVRNGEGRPCLSCGKRIQQEYEICPYCSHSVNLHCSSCNQQVAADWQVCPHCRHDLTHDRKL